MRWEFGGCLEPAAGCRCVRHEFELPAGARQLTIRVRYARTGNTFPVLLAFDPTGWRGEAKSYSRGETIELELAVGDLTSPGAVPGELVAGRWAIEMVGMFGQAPLEYHAAAEATICPGEPPADEAAERFFPDLSRSLRPEPGWYRGDFHLHSTFSDGWYTPRQMVDMAVTGGVDFFAITDHNAVGSYRSFATIEDVPVIPGIEVSAIEGHTNIFGLQGWLDWRAGCDGLTLDGILRSARERGLVTSISHPTLSPWEWQVMDTPMELVDCLEVANDPSYPGNDRETLTALALWTACLNAGRRITAIGGSDAFHHPLGRSYRGIPERLAQPSTYVYAHELSCRAILDGVRAGRVYVTLGPRLSFTAASGTHTHDIADEVEPGTAPLTFAANATGVAAGDQLRLIRCGKVIFSQVAAGAEADLEYAVAAPDPAGTWYRLDVLRADGLFVATTNPIFIGRSEPRPVTFGEMLEVAQREMAAAEAGCDPR